VNDTSTRFGRYELLEVLGEGGMARVLRAVRAGPMGFRKEVAIKQILPHVAKEEKLLRALINEARLGGYLRHRNIVEVYEFDQVDDTYYIAMEYVKGHTLDRVVARVANQGYLPNRIVVQIAAQICDGLQYAHNARDDQGKPMNLVHRDLKPANVMVERDGVVKIMDFGIARSEVNLFQTTTASVTKGTPVYMSPEQVTGERVDCRSDIFSLGSVIVELITGDIAFSGTQLYQVLQKVAGAQTDEQIARVQQRFPAMVPVLERAMQLDREARFASAAEMGVAVRALEADLPGDEALGTWLGPWMGRASEPVQATVEAPNLAEAGPPPQTTMSAGAASPVEAPAPPAVADPAEQATLPSAGYQAVSGSQREASPGSTEGLHQQPSAPIQQPYSPTVVPPATVSPSGGPVVAQPPTGYPPAQGTAPQVDPGAPTVPMAARSAPARRRPGVWLIAAAIVFLAFAVLLAGAAAFLGTTGLLDGFLGGPGAVVDAGDEAGAGDGEAAVAEDERGGEAATPSGETGQGDATRPVHANDSTSSDADTIPEDDAAVDEVTEAPEEVTEVGDPEGEDEDPGTHDPDGDDGTAEADGEVDVAAGGGGRDLADVRTEVELPIPGRPTGERQETDDPVPQRILRGLESEEPARREDAAEDLEDCQGREASRLIEQLVKGDPQASVRRQAIRAGRKRSTAPDVRIAIWALKHDSEVSVRTEACRSLGSYADRASLRPLCRALMDDGSAAVRREAARTLGRIGNTSCLPALQHQLDDETDSSAAEAIRRAIDALGG